MGARLTSFENRSRMEMEIRVFISPTRADRFITLARIKPGGVKEIATKLLLCRNKSTGPDNPAFVMVFLDGKFVLFHPKVLCSGDKIICDVGEAGLLDVSTVVKCGFPGVNRIRGFSYFLGRDSQRSSKKHYPWVMPKFFTKREQRNSKAV